MLVDEVAHYLAAAGLGLTVGSNLFTDPWPETVEGQAVSIVVYDGDAAAHGAGPSLADPLFGIIRFKVTVRAAQDGVIAGRQLAFAIFKKLHNLAEMPLGASPVRYLHVVSRDGFEPQYLREDENGRRIYECDFEARKEPSSV